MNKTNRLILMFVLGGALTLTDRFVYFGVGALITAWVLLTGTILIDYAIEQLKKTNKPE